VLKLVPANPSLVADFGLLPLPGGAAPLVAWDVTFAGSPDSLLYVSGTRTGGVAVVIVSPDDCYTGRVFTAWVGAGAVPWVRRFFPSARVSAAAAKAAGLAPLGGGACVGTAFTPAAL